MKKLGLLILLSVLLSGCSGGVGFWIGENTTSTVKQFIV